MACPEVVSTRSVAAEGSRPMHHAKRVAEGIPEVERPFAPWTDRDVPVHRPGCQPAGPTVNRLQVVDGEVQMLLVGTRVEAVPVLTRAVQGEDDPPLPGHRPLRSPGSDDEDADDWPLLPCGQSRTNLTMRRI